MTLRFTPILLAALVLFADSASVAQNFWEQTNGPYGGDVVSIARSPNGNLFVDCGEGLFRTSDNGNHWVLCNDSLTGPMAISSVGSIFVGTDSDGIFRSTDNGETWATTNSGINDNIYNLVFGKGILVATALMSYQQEGGAIFVSTNDGVNWSEVYEDQYDGVGSLCIDSSGIIYVAAGPINPIRSLDSGNTWTVPDSSVPVYGITPVCISMGSIIYGVSYSDSIWRSTDSGNSWISTGLVPGRPSTLMVDENGILYSGGNYADPYVHVSSDEGATWQQVLEVDGTNCFYSDTSGAIFVGSENGIFMSRSDTFQWNEIGLPSTYIPSLAIDNKGNVFAPGCTTTNEGNSWTNWSIPSGWEGFPAVVCIGSNDTLIVATDQNVYWSGNADTTWSGSLPDLSNNLIVSLVTDNNNNVFAGTVQNGVFIAADNWIRKDSGITKRFVWSLALDSNGFLIAGTDSGIFRSSDDGNSWSNSIFGIRDTTVNSIAVSSRGLIFAGTVSGIYRSGNSGGNWTQVNSGLTGTTDVTSFAFNSKGDVFAGTTNGVFISTNEGDTWLPVNSGLTNTYVLSLACDHNDILYAGTNGSAVFRSVNPTSSVSENADNLSFLTLDQNSPNPFTQNTTISFMLPEPSFITLTLYDATGREVAALANGFMDAGEHDVPFQRGNTPSGVYFYRLESGGQSATRAMVVEP